MPWFSRIETLFLTRIDGLKNFNTFQARSLAAFLSPSVLQSNSNCSTRSPSMPSSNAGGQNHSRKRRARNDRLLIFQRVGRIGQRRFYNLKAHCNRSNDQDHEHWQDKQNPTRRNPICVCQQPLMYGKVRERQSKQRRYHYQLQKVE